MRLEDEDLVPSSTEASMSSSIGGAKLDGQPAKGEAPSSQQQQGQLVQELIDENTKLFEENKRLGARRANLRLLIDVVSVVAEADEFEALLEQEEY